MRLSSLSASPTSETAGGGEDVPRVGGWRNIRKSYIGNLYLGSSLIESMFTLTLLFGWSADLDFQGYFVLKGMCLFLAIWYS